MKEVFIICGSLWFLTIGGVIIWMYFKDHPEGPDEEWEDT